MGKELFEGLAIWKEEGYRLLQGAYPVIILSFAKVKTGTFPDTRKQICQIITELYNKEMPPNNLRKSVAVSTDFIRFTLNKMRRLFSGSS